MARTIDRVIATMDKIIATGEKIGAIQAHLYFVKESKVARHLPGLKRQYETLWSEHDELFEQFTQEWRAKHGTDH